MQNLIKSSIIFFFISCIISLPQVYSQTEAKKVIFDHDGGIDDLLSLLLLTQMEEVELVGVCVTPADCFLEDATISSLKLLKMNRLDNCPVAKGNVRPVNPFPNEWRAQPMVANAFPMMLNAEENLDQLSPLSADEFIAAELSDTEEAITILITGPCSNLTKALTDHPHLINKVKEVIWMGGAVDVRGNVATHTHDESAEWNAYWDPMATRTLLELGLEVTLIPLDVTNSVPVNMAFLKRLAQQSDYPLSDLASQLWATTINTIPSYEYTYFMWDVLATSYVTISDQFEVERIELSAHIDLPSEGRTYRDPNNGKWIDVAKKVNVEPFYDYILSLLRR